MLSCVSALARVEQAAADALLHTFRGCGCEGHGRYPQHALGFNPVKDVTDAQVSWPEIVPPLADTVCLIHGQQLDADAAVQVGKGGRQTRQCLRAHVDHVVGARHGRRLHLFVRLRRA